MRYPTGLAVLALAAVPVSALGKGGSGSDPGSSGDSQGSLSLVEGGQAQKVVIREQADGSRSGDLSLLLHNGSKERIRPKVCYFPDNGRRPIVVGNGTAPASRRGVASAIPANQDGAVALRFTLAGTAQPEELDGLLSIGAKASAGGGATGSKRCAVSSPLNVRLTAEAQGAQGVSFVPATVTLHVQHGWLFDSGESGTVHLEGLGVPALLARVQARHKPFSTTALLSNGNGDELTVELTDLRATEGTPTSAQATLRVTGKDQRGSYEGELSLPASAGDDPKLTVKVDVADALPGALVIVALAAFLGGYALPRHLLRRRADSLKQTLKSAVNAYDAARNGDHAGRESDDATRQNDADRQNPPPEPASWTLDDLLGPSPAEAGRWQRPGDYDPNLPEEYGVTGLYFSIEDDSAAPDLESDRVRANAVIDAIERWRRVELPAAELRTTLTESEIRPPRAGWLETGVWRDAHLLLSEARSDPGTDQAAASLAQRLVRHQAVYSAFVDAWNKKAALDAEQNLSDEAKALLAKIDLKPFGADQKIEADRTAPEQRAYEFAVFNVNQKLREISELPEEKVKEFGARIELDFIVGPLSVAGLRDLIPGVIKLFPWPLRKPISVETPTQTAQRTRQSDLVWTLIGVALGVAVYTAGIYTSTWGTFSDWVTAIAAGYTSGTVVRWAQMPISLSLRRTTPISGADGQTGDGSNGSNKPPDPQNAVTTPKPPEH